MPPFGAKICVDICRSTLCFPQSSQFSWSVNCSLLAADNAREQIGQGSSRLIHLRVHVLNKCRPLMFFFYPCCQQGLICLCIFANIESNQPILQTGPLHYKVKSRPLTGSCLDCLSVAVSVRILVRVVVCVLTP